MQSGYPDYEPLINPSFYITKLPSSFKALMVEIYNQEEVYQLDCSHINFLYCSKDLTECTLLLGF